MCGIAGKISPGSVEPSLLERMCDLLEHRGPDSRGTFLDAGAGFAVQRLAVIDVEHGGQPVYNEDRSVVVVLNGEIYNYLELRERLLRAGHHFRTASDTEVIVHLYERYGDRCVEHLRGMFAFAVWDRRSRRLLLARDRIGKKPLFYAHVGDALWFASEARAILVDESVPRDFDPVALDGFLHYQYVPAPRSAFAALRKLPAAHVLTFERGQVSTRRYWKLSFRPELESLGDEELIRLLRERLLEATRLRLRSDVPVGAFLSGGIDSSSVVAAMARLTSEPLKTFSVGFDVPQFDETAYAREVARAYGTDHHEVRIGPEALDVLPRLVWHYGEPFADSSAIPCFYLSELARRHVTVALAGDGGDEIFAGYHRYQRVAQYRGQVGPDRDVRPGDDHLLAFFSHLLSWDYFGAPERHGFYTPEFLAELGDWPFLSVLAEPYARSDARDPLGRIIDVDLQTRLAQDILVKVDIASMAHSLEVRSPLLDHVLLETAASIPTDRKLSNGSTKVIYKEAVRDWLPPSILDRPKMGFAVPLADWLRSARADLTDNVLLDPRTLDRGILRPPAVRRLLAEHRSGDADHSGRIWAMLQLETWFRTYVDRAPTDGAFVLA